VIIEPTASVFILRRDREHGWLAALVRHPRLECWLPAGGHVEADETAAQCGIREALEETGLDVRLVPGPAAPVAAGFPHRLVPAPWLVAEVPAPDRHTGERHVHAGHVYVATTASPAPPGNRNIRSAGSPRPTSPRNRTSPRTPGSWPPNCSPSPPRSPAPGSAGCPDKAASPRPDPRLSRRPTRARRPAATVPRARSG
jgi:8-oxo-dGTP pyrophosphatase MutT (NUDIX family)